MVLFLSPMTTSVSNRLRSFARQQRLALSCLPTIWQQSCARYITSLQNNKSHEQNANKYFGPPSRGTRVKVRNCRKSDCGFIHSRDFSEI
jgi:hypothetical protein